MENEANSPSSISLENSEWVAENIKGLDQTVKEMLLLFENDGVEQPELIACVKDISHRHHLLAAHYNKLTEMKNLNSQLDHRFLTPDKKLGMQNVATCDLSLSSGGGISDTTPVEGSESSLLSSDSDSESYTSSPRPSAKMLKHEKGGDYEMLMRLSDYEKELKVSKEKLVSAEEDIAKLKKEVLGNEAFMIKMGNMEAQIKCYEADIGREKENTLMLQRQVVDLETKLESEKRQVDELQESVKCYSSELSDVMQKLQDASESFAQEKRQLKSSVSKLSECLAYHEGRANELHKQCESLESEKTKIVRNHEALQSIWLDSLECAKIEKDGVDAKLQTLNTDLTARDDQIQRLERILLELQSENEQLRAGSDTASKITAELKSRILELEKELGMQAVMISDTAEGKREAIKQLCIAIDHYRSVYQRLREEYATGKRPASSFCFPF